MLNAKNKKIKQEAGVYDYSRQERALLKKRKDGIGEMWEKKKTLGIDRKCDRMDALYTPHNTSLENPDSVAIQTSPQFQRDEPFIEKSRKSTPLAFEKVTTAVATLIKENPRAVMKAWGGKYKDKNEIVKNVYYENFSINRKKYVLVKYVYHLSKYGLGYWREYIKRTYRKQHFQEEDAGGNIKNKVKWVYDINDVVGENLPVRNVLLDDNCISVKDVNRPARDLAIIAYKTKDEFEAEYPEDIFPNSAFVRMGQPHMLPEHYDKTENLIINNKSLSKIQVVIYENVFENLQETWANGVPIKSVPLPGNMLSVSGDKWVEDLDNYDGIGLGNILELYLPLVDDIVNSSLERLRLAVRPNEDWFNGIELTDESDDVPYGSNNVRKFNGSPDSIKYSDPPARSDAEVKEKEEILEEIDRVTFVPRNLGGGEAKAKTAYQESLQKEAALRKLALPLEAIKKTIEDCANLDIALYQELYTQPEETLELKPGDEDFDEAMAIYNQDKELGISLEKDDRIAVNELGDDGNPVSIMRRKFKTFELPLKAEIGQDGKPTGRIIEGEEKAFWEMTPPHFDWRGYVEIIAESFLPPSKALDDEQKKETIEFLLNVPTTDEMGRPTLIDASGKPYTIDRVKLIKERASMNRALDPDSFVVPMLANAGQGDMNVPESENPLQDKQIIKPKSLLGIENPENGPAA